MEWWNGTAWAPLGGATGGGSDKVFYESDRYIRHSFELPAGKNFLTSGVLQVSKELTITSIVGNGTTLTVSVDEAHLCAAGDQFEIFGTTSYNGEYIVTGVSSPTQVTASTTITAAAETTGSFEKEVVITFGTDAVWTHV